MHKAQQNIMLPWGDDFTFMNARQQYKQLELVISLCNSINTQGMKFV